MILIIFHIFTGLQPAAPNAFSSPNASPFIQNNTIRGSVAPVGLSKNMPGLERDYGKHDDVIDDASSKKLHR